MRLSNLVLPSSAVAIALLALSGGTPSAGASAQELVYATYLPATATETRVDIWFMEEVERRTDGQVTFETYYGGALLPAADVYPGLSRGAADIAMGAPQAYNPSDYPLSNVTLPFLTSNVDTVTHAFKETYDANEDLRGEFERHNVRVLYALGFSENTVWSRSPIHSADDLQGMRVRAVMAIADALEALGATPVAMPWPEGIEGLQRGVIDGMSSAPLLTAVNTGLHEAATYVSDGANMGVYAVALTAINRDIWEGLDPEIQEIILEVADEAPEHYMSLLDEEVEAVVDTLIEYGRNEVILIPEEETARIRETLASHIWEAWIEQANAMGADGEALFNTYREAVERLDQESTYVPGLQRYMERQSE